MTSRPAQPSPRAPLITVLVLGLFLFSGISGLMYEVAWSRLFALVLGTTTHAAATVLGVFMAGLALGSWLIGKRADRSRSGGLRIYALLELCIGAYALVLPLLMSCADDLYRWLWPAVADSFAGMMALRFALAAAVLIVPATLMGGTLPALSRFLVRRLDRSGRDIGTLYAINTLGAVIGCFGTGFFLLEHLGIRGTLLAAAALNFAVGSLALWFSRRGASRAARAAPAQELEPERRFSPSQLRATVLLYALSGFAALALEVLWTRCLMYFISADSWAFTAMLTAFLLGLGLGSWVMALLSPRIRNPLLAIGILQLMVGLGAAASIPLFEGLHDLVAAIAKAFTPQDRFSQQIAMKIGAALLIMLAPTLLMGATFPLVSAVYVGATRAVGRGTGRIYALNTLGAIGGATLAGFLMIPALGLQASILMVSSLYIAIGLLFLVVAARPARRRLAVSLAALALAVLVLANLLFQGTPIILSGKLFKSSEEGFELRYYHEGSAATIAVLENKNNTRILNINGITTAINNYRDMQVHRILSHLPMLLHPRPRRVLIVGFGMGSTAWGCCQYAEVERVDVVELLRDEVATAGFFEDINHGVLQHPKLHFIVGDGRNYLLATRERYDVISFNAIHPRFSANLYTSDFYELCRGRLSPDGILCAWLTQNSMNATEWRMLCRSLVSVFPHTSLWYCNPEHFCLIAQVQPPRVDLEAWRRRMAQAGVREDLADSNLADPLVLLTRYLIGDRELRAYVAGAPLNTDDRPLIEFSRETKRDELPIVQRLVELKRSSAQLLAPGALSGGMRARLKRCDTAARWMMRGQINHWYERTGGLMSRVLTEMNQRRALLEWPENEDIRENLAFSGRFLRRLRSELELAPGDPVLRTQLAQALREKGSLEEAERILNRTLGDHPGFLPARMELGLVLLLLGRPRESVAAASKAVAAALGPRVIYREALSRTPSARGSETGFLTAASTSLTARR